MKWCILLITIISAYSTAYDIISETERTQPKLWHKYNSCGKSLKDEIYRKAVMKCADLKSETAQMNCELTVEEETEELIESDLMSKECGSLRPTTYVSRDDPYKIEHSGSLGGLLAFNEKQFTISEKIFNECAAVGDVDCSHRLGVMIFYGLSFKKDINRAITLLRYAAKNGHEESVLFLNENEIPVE
jgi:hypothetical protein